MIKIGSAKIDTKIMLAPLSGCTDLALRLVSREHGAKFCFFEMADSNSLVRGPRPKTLELLQTVEADRPIAAQILGEDPSMMLRAAKILTGLAKVSFLDVNAACPARKVIKKGAGSYLLKDTETLFRMLKKLSSSLSIPVTVKIRLGYDELNLSHIVKTAKKCESSGAAAVFVHGRTRAEGYKGETNYEAIKAIKEAVNVPVFGSGNIFDGYTAKKMFSLTGCDGIMVARGALGNPWIFREIEGCLSGVRPAGRVGIPEKMEVLKRHLSYIAKYRESSASGSSGYMRKFAIWYTRGLPGAAQMRRKLNLVKDYPGMVKLIDTIR